MLASLVREDMLLSPRSPPSMEKLQRDWVPASLPGGGRGGWLSLRANWAHSAVPSLPHSGQYPFSFALYPTESTKPHVGGQGCPFVTVSLSPVLSPVLLIKMAPVQNCNLDFSLTFMYATGHFLRFSIYVPLIRQITLSLINTSWYYRRQKKPVSCR